MTDALKGLKEKMAFGPRFKHCPHHDQATHIRHKGMYDGAKLENRRLQSIVLKEVGELLDALEVAQVGLKESCMCGSHPEGLRDWCDACDAIKQIEQRLGANHVD